MNRYFYDLHLHSCLSPCAEDDMTPANIAGMGSLCGLQLMALTDHNSCGNCRAFLQACRQYGIVGVPGMELTTAEEIHLVCLFPDLEQAEAFDRAVQTKRFPIRNKPAVFGNQYYMDAEDKVLGEEPNLLIPATRLDLEAGTAAVRCPETVTEEILIGAVTDAGWIWRRARLWLWPTAARPSRPTSTDPPTESSAFWATCPKGPFSPPWS